MTVYLTDDSSNILENIEIKLLNKSKNIIKTKNTDSAGSVKFTRLNSGNYYIRINKQAGFKVFTDKLVSVDGATIENLVLELE